MVGHGMEMVNFQFDPMILKLALVLRPSFVKCLLKYKNGRLLNLSLGIGCSGT